jgi:hypothetical protein
MLDQTLAGEFQDLIDGESNEPEGKMGEHLSGSTNANVPCAEFILEAAVDAFHCGALLETVLLRPRQLGACLGEKTLGRMDLDRPLRLGCGLTIGTWFRLRQCSKIALAS